MPRKTRLMAVAQEILKNPSVSLIELATRFQVSTMTIRRDLKYLESNGMLSSFPNIPRLSPGIGQYVFMEQAAHARDSKQRIANYARSLIEPNDIIIFDTGTTVHLLGMQLPNDISFTAICYNENLLPYLTDRENIQLILIGGYYHRGSRSFESIENVKFLRNLRATKIFVSTAGAEHSGLTCFSQYEVIMKSTAIQCSLRKILLTDSTKFGLTKPAYFSSLEDMDEIVTDQDLSSEWREYLEGKNLKLTIV
ncbi:MAG: DeoR/GlpR family DNA-binding transcription regulator [Peptoniphilaceae bacterium]|nr:DeoR/GlpR family DNA-binding transcription regulator [Peptoniphilaceae bacterium]MDY3075471.1 DeoR/GlpR family DNA-binding transcription regulator [Peptoniphilaceae bacterium]